MTSQQLAEAIVNAVLPYCQSPVQTKVLTATILPLIAEFKKEVAGEVWTVSYEHEVLGYHTPDRETYIDNLNK